MILGDRLIETPHANLAHPARLGPDAANPRSSRGARRAILIAACIVRLLVILMTFTQHAHDWIFSRGMEMGLIADSLVHGLGYSSPFGGATGPTAFIAPGYPTIVAAIFLIFGSYSFASALVVMLLNLAFNLLTIWLIMRIAGELFNETAALIGGAIWALSLPLLFMPTIFWETSISACAMVGMIAFSLGLRNRPSPTRWLCFGTTIAVAGLINPALLPAMLAIFAWTAYDTMQWRTTAAPWFGLLLCAAIFSVWPIRNALRFHAFIPTRTTVGFELWMANRPTSTGFLDESVVPIFNRDEFNRFTSMGELAYTRDKTEQARQFILGDKSRFALLSLRRVVRFWTGTGNTASSAFYLLHACFTTGFGVLGLIFLFRDGRRRLAILFALPLLLFPLPYYITHAEFRYRLNIDGIMTILAAFALARLFAAKSSSSDPVPTTADPA